jgi:opacity protein-like surface antigen
MKKLTLSLIAVIMLAGVSQADTIEQDIYEPDNGAIYGGLAYGQFNHNISNIDFAGASNVGVDVNTLMIQGGYRYNQYLSLEGRYWYGLSDIKQTGGVTPGSYDGDANSWGIYFKPTLPIEDRLKAYALLGYGSSSIEFGNDKWDTDGFSWGFGLELDLIENFSAFADYVSVATADKFNYTYTSGAVLSDTDASINVYTFNLGLNYKFAF